MSKKSFTLNYDIDLLSMNILNGLKERHDSLNYSDKTEFFDEGFRFQVHTYEIYSFFERGYITVNLCLFEKTADHTLSVKVSVFSPVKDSSRKCKKIMQEIEEIIFRT